mmetsp:Transcript_9305/g.39504  ORF Transcript_9305/g.39504 Transcript_9305/m.39504 type:complete len:238 (-) Transcript_9305:294-1007(-)
MAASRCATTSLLARGRSTTPCSSFTSPIFFMDSRRLFANAGSRTRPASKMRFTPADKSATARFSWLTLHDAKRSWWRARKCATDAEPSPSPSPAPPNATPSTMPPSETPNACGSESARALPGGLEPGTGVSKGIADGKEKRAAEADPLAPPKRGDDPGSRDPAPVVVCFKGSVALQCGQTRVGEPTTVLHPVHSLRPLPSGVPGPALALAPRLFFPSLFLSFFSSAGASRRSPEERA